VLIGIYRIAVLNFSSGTTGPPKACMVTHHNLVANAEQTLVLDKLARKRKSDSTYATGDIHCAYVPLYHASKLHFLSILPILALTTFSGTANVLHCERPTRMYDSNYAQIWPRTIIESDS
jgi:acyl-CoA synthetase (AMP-forming)/AMP-acid ligase II